MGRFLGTVDTALTFSVLSATALDPRIVVDTKEELTKAETWPRSGESVYIYDGQVVYVKSEQCAYALVDKNNYTDVYSWKYVGGYEDIYAYDIKSEAIQDTDKIVDETLKFSMISNTTTVSGIYYDENNNYFYRTVHVAGATGSVETKYYLTWEKLGDNIISSEELGEVRDGKTYPKTNTTYYCEYQDADGKQDFTIPLDFNGFVSGKLYISVLNGKMYKASSSNSLITVSGGDSSYLLNRLIALEKAGAEDDVLEFNGMVNTEDIVEPSVAANNYTIAFDTHNKQFVAYESSSGKYYANWKENDFNKPSAAYGEKMYHGIKPTAGKIYIDISTNQIYRWNGVDLIALNATADSIQIGKNSDSNTYKISLNSDGSGHLANKGIEWDADGDVTFGPNVTLNWDNIENPPTPPTGEGTFKSTVFTRTNTIPDTPIGGSYNNPIPDGDIWSDGIPDGEETLWASTRVFSTLGEDSELELVKEGWVTPKKMTDTASFNVEFSKSTTPVAPTDFIDGETEEQWREKNPDWENISDENTIWMATNTRKNGVWDGWQVSKIKGEKGDNGTSISIKKGANLVESIEKLPTTAAIGDICFVGSIDDMDTVVLYVYQESGWVKQTGIQLGDSYLVDEWLFIWDGDSWIKSQFKGDPGKSSYMHIKYANSANVGDWTGRDENEAGQQIIPDDKTSWGETPGAYMGIYSDNIETDSKDWNAYKWIKWEGQDGLGYEYVYKTTTSNEAPELSENEYKEVIDGGAEITHKPSDDGFIPYGWADDPISISSEEPFCWMAARQKVDGKWSSFKISLWAKWGSDSIKLDLDNDNDSIMYRDDTPISTVVSNATLYDGIYPVTDNIEYSITDWGTAEGELVNNQITITSISTPSTSVKIRAEYKKNEYFATLSIKKLVNADKYEIICTPNAIPHNIDKGIGQTTQHIISVDTYKTSFETGKRELLTELPEGYTLICDVNDGNSNNDNVTISNGKYILDITDSNKPDSLTFTLNKEIVINEEATTEVLDSETIPVNYVEDGRGVSEIVTHFAISDSDKIEDVKDSEVDGEIVSKVEWYISAPAVTPNKPFLWQRVKTIYTKGDPTEWSYNMVGRMGENGISPNAAFKSTVFTRTNITPDTPSADVTTINDIEYNTYDNPIPGDVNGKNELIWSDGIPVGDAILWASTRIFSNDGQKPQQDTWTEPKKMTDTSDFDVEYSSLESPGTPSGHPNTNTNWSNTANEKTIWMATSTCKNGEWSDWKVSKIKGEKGEDGQSIKVAGRYETLADFEAEWKKNGEWVAPTNDSDCYVVDTNLYVWDGDSWENAGPFKGDPGKSAFMHIKYAKSAEVNSWTDNNGETPGAYIGVCTDENIDDPMEWDKYTWTKWRGEDGFGYEYIYKATKSASDAAPQLPKVANFETDESFQKDGFIPAGWSDNPIDVSEELRYCWTCYRQKVGGIWQEFKGSKNEDGTETGCASLWSHWAVDGAPGVGIVSMTRRYLITAAYTDENGNDITIEKIKELYGPTDETPVNAAWQSNSPTVTSEKPLLVEWIHTVYTSGAEDDDYAIVGRIGAPGLDGSLIEYIYRLTKDNIAPDKPTTSDTITSNNEGEWTDDPLSVKEDYPYQWISEREFDRANNKWGDYSTPVLWSIWSKGENSVHLDLDNEMDSFLYDGNGGLLSDSITTTPTLYDGLELVTDGIEWNINAPTTEDGNYSFNSTSGVLTVNKMSATENTVVYSIIATYKETEYVSSLTIKKLVGVDKYDLVVTPNSITYNTSDESASAESINIKVYRTSQGEGRKLITNLNSYKPIEIHVDGVDISSEYKEDGYTFELDYTKSSIGIDLVKDGIVVDTETIPINKSKNGVNGSAIRLDLSNENDSMLYDSAGTLLSGNVISTATLYNGTEIIPIGEYSLEIVSTNCVATLNTNTITVSSISTTSANVEVVAVYEGVPYITHLNIKKLVGVDKYDLAITPNSITHNTSTGVSSASNINIGVYRTSQNAGRKLVTNLKSYNLILTINGTDATNAYTATNGNFNPQITNYIANTSDIKVILTDSNGVVLDSETIPINKSANGTNGSNAIRLDLDNENDSMLYDGANNLLSGNVISNVSLYDGSVKVSNDKIKWYLSDSNGINISNSSAINQDGYITSNTPITDPDTGVIYKIVDAGSYFNWNGSTFSIIIQGYVYKNETPWSNCTIYFNDDKSVINYNIGSEASIEENKNKNQATTNSDGYFKYEMDNNFISTYGLADLKSSTYIGANIYPGNEVYPNIRVYRCESANSKNDAWITTSGKVTVTGVTETSNYIQIKGEYPTGKYHYANLSIKKLVGIDKYDLIITPNSFTYNETTDSISQADMSIEVYRTSQNGTREIVQNLDDFKLELEIENANPNGEYENGISATPIPADHDDIKVILKDSNGAVLDSETIPINKSKNGENGENGKNGENAITYEIIPDISYFTKASDSSSASGQIGGFVYKIDGNNRTKIKSDTLVQYPWSSIAAGKLYIAAGYYDSTGSFKFIHNPSVDTGSTDVNKNGRFDTGAYFTNITTATTDNRKGVLSSNSITVELRDSNNIVLAAFSVSAAKNGMAGESKQSAPLRVSEWASGTTYYTGYEENAPWSDTVHYNGKYYRCIAGHQANAGTKPDNTTYWKEFDGQFQSIATGLLLAENAYVNLLSGNTINIKDSLGNITAGMSGGDGIQLWAGGQQETANFRVERDGDVSINGLISEKTTNITSSIYFEMPNGGTLGRPRYHTHINLEDIKSINLDQYCKNMIVTLPQSQDILFGDKNYNYIMKGYNIAGTKLTISKQYDVEVANWGLWKEFEGDMATYNPFASNTQECDLLESASLICADARMLNPTIANGDNSMLDMWISPKDDANTPLNLKRANGSFVINGRLCKVILLLPGQSLHLTSGFYRYRTTDGYEDILAWYVDNPSEFVNISKTMVHYIGWNLSYGQPTTYKYGSFSAGGWAPDTDWYDDLMFGAPPLDDRLYTHDAKHPELHVAWDSWVDDNGTGICYSQPIMETILPT